MPELIAAVAKRSPGVSWRYCKGFLQKYRPGGHQPLRVLNLGFVYLRLLAETLWFRPDVILVRSTPPGVQILAALLGRIFGIRVICWLMDYHPEIEARMADAKGWHGLASSLRAVDGAALRAMDCVIVLDRAMASLCRSRAPETTIVIHPTWNRGNSAFTPMRLNGSRTELHLAYAGNLGAAHDTSTLVALMKQVNSRIPVRLTVIGAPLSGQRKFAELAQATGVRLECLDRIPFAELGTVFARLGVEIGVVLMTDESAGLVSPSKFSGYIAYGRPVLYVGPPETNAEDVVTVFGAGIGLPNAATPEQLEVAAKSLADGTTRAGWALRVEAASVHYNALGGDSLVEALRPHLSGKSYEVAVSSVV